MRKLTGYIGAMIIVFALMGSILAGYALNINGTSTVMNEYEKVTDVSGLYSHTQEPSYIDYNPASNYINYSIGETVFENTGLKMKMMKPGDSVTFTVSGVTYGGENYVLPENNTYVFGCTYGYLYSIPGNPGIYWTNANGDYGVSTITYGWDGNTLTISSNVSTYTKSTGIAPYFYYPYDDYDGIATNRANIYHYSNLTGWSNGKSFLIYGWADPAYNGNGFYVYGSDGWNTLRMFPYGDEIPFSDDGFYWASDDVISNGVNRGWPTTNYSYGGSTYPLWYVIGPRYVYASDPLGINYTESNRVNNYLINTDPANTTTTETTIDLMNISAANQYPVYDGYWRNTLYMVNRLTSDYPYPHYSYTAPYWIYQNTNANSYNGADMLINYKLSDILSTYSIPQGTTSLKITTNSNGVISGGNGLSFDANICGFVTINPGTIGYTINNLVGEKDYLVYDITNNTCTIYDYNGVVQSTNTPDNIGVVFCKNTGANYSSVLYNPDISTVNTSFVEMSNRPAPFIKITSYQYNPAYNHYMDITKGLFIKNTNVVNTVWDNEYSNGRIQILFRSSETIGTYHNGLIVGDNSISIDYTTNRYYITLNNGDPVDIGTWRNIVLDIDLINGKLSVIPVRTFNSFTNVVMDNTNIFIGDLVNAAPVNTIEWTPTLNSLAFNVYSTSVFMDTYGVVMVDPTLNITDYFTTLDNFYQLRLSNFSMYGQTMTVNGVTGTVTGDKITFNDETVQLKDMAITYADGNVTISDSYGNIDLGAIVDNTVSMTGAWYFTSDLYSGYTTQKVIYDWDWGEFVLEDKAFGVIYIGLCLIGLIVARHFCTLTITDYLLFFVSIAIALTVPVIA